MATGPISRTGFHRNHILECETLASEISTGTAASKAVTINDYMGLITTESLTTAQNASDIVTLTNDKIAAGDLVFVSLSNGTNTQGTPALYACHVSANTAVIRFANLHASSQAFNGTLLLSFIVIKAL
jgi:hypothetical protein